MSIFVLGSFEIVVSFCLDSYLWSSFSFRASICRSRSKPRPSALLLCEPSSYPLVLLFSRASIKRPEVTRQLLDLWVHLLELGHGFCHKPDTMTSKAPDLVLRFSPPIISIRPTVTPFLFNFLHHRWPKPWARARFTTSTSRSRTTRTTTSTRRRTGPCASCGPEECTW